MFYLVFATDTTTSSDLSLLEIIINKAQSDVVLLTVILAIVIIVAGKPLYKMFLENIANRQKRVDEREKRIIKVIQDNSTVITELKTILIQAEQVCKSCKVEQMARFKHLEDMAQSNQLVLNDLSRSIEECKNILLTKQQQE